MNNLHWTNKKPTEEGWYWLQDYEFIFAPTIISIRDRNGNKDFIACYTNRTFDLLNDMNENQLWYGPIEPPSPIDENVNSTQ